MKKVRQVKFYKDYFERFYLEQNSRVRSKLIWTFRILEEVDSIPSRFFRSIVGVDGLYEIRVQVGSDIFRVFCFFDEERVIVIGNGFRKKTQKTPRREIKRAERIMHDYYEGQE